MAARLPSWVPAPWDGNKSRTDFLRNRSFPKLEKSFPKLEKSFPKLEKSFPQRSKSFSLKNTEDIVTIRVVMSSVFDAGGSFSSDIEKGKEHPGATLSQ